MGNPGALAGATGAEAGAHALAGHVSIAHSESGRDSDALRLAQAGLPVFPCHPETKAPLVEHGLYAATTDSAQIARWWANWPAALIAVPMGEPSGLFVVDLDIDRDTGEAVGEASLAALGIHLVRQPHRLRTRSGGWHLIYRWADGLRNTAGRPLGIDTRGTGGYAIAWEPRVLIAAIQDPDLPLPPQSLLAALAGAPAHQSAPAPMQFDFDPGVASAQAWADAALRAEAARVASAMPGTRNDTLNRSAFALGQIVAAGGLPRVRVAAELQTAAQMAGLDPREAARTTASGLHGGAKSPRTPPDRVTLPETIDAWPQPDLTLLAPERGKPPNFPADVFGPEWGAWIADAADAKGAPQDYIGGALLTVAGSLIGNARWACPWEGWQEPPILWAMLIGNPSAGKSPALDAVLDPLKALETRVRTEAETARKTWAAEAETAQLALSAWKAAAKAAISEGKEAPAKPGNAEPGPEPHQPRLRINDATIEKLAALAARQPRGLLSLRDELSGWLGNMTRYAGGGSDRPFWLEAFGGRPYSVERMGREPVWVDRLSISVVGGIQPDRLSTLLLKADDDGLLARLMPIWPDPAPLIRPTRAPDLAFAERAYAALYGLEMPTDADGRTRPWFLRLSEPATARLQSFRELNARHVDAASGQIKSFLGKMPGLSVRIALVLAHLDWAAAPHGRAPGQIETAHIARAVRYVSDYLLPMAQRAYADAAIPSDERGAMRLARLIRTDRPETLGSREVQRRKLTGLREAKDIEASLAALVSAGWLIRCPEPTKGRTKTVWHVNPRIWADTKGAAPTDTR